MPSVTCSPGSNSTLCCCGGAWCVGLAKCPAGASAGEAGGVVGPGGHVPGAGRGVTSREARSGTWHRGELPRPQSTRPVSSKHLAPSPQWGTGRSPPADNGQGQGWSGGAQPQLEVVTRALDLRWAACSAEASAGPAEAPRHTATCLNFLRFLLGSLFRAAPELVGFRSLPGHPDLHPKRTRWSPALLGALWVPKPNLHLPDSGASKPSR